MNHYSKKFGRMVNNYLIARLRRKPSTASFWYLPELLHIHTRDDLDAWVSSDRQSPLYPVDYRSKLRYSLENEQGIIVLPYDEPIGHQVNPEAAFQYALGLHDHFTLTTDRQFLKKFLHYAEFFSDNQTREGFWHYPFDWFDAKAPWSSALAQARGASVMLRAWLQTGEGRYRERAIAAFRHFTTSTGEGGFLHPFPRGACFYFEEYPLMPTGVINGFMSSLISLWDVKRWIQEPWLEDLWVMGIASLEKMLPHYTTGWWSLYDLDAATPVMNVNSPRYHLLESRYLQVLGLLSASAILLKEQKERVRQYYHMLNKCRAVGLKLKRKLLYK